MDERPKERIPKHTGWLIMGTAIFLELVSLIPGLNWVTDAASIFIFPFWFILHGVPFFKNPKILKGSLLVVILEAIPFISALPALSIGIYKAISTTQKADQAAITAWENAQNEAYMKNQEAIAAQNYDYSGDNTREAA